MFPKILSFLFLAAVPLGYAQFDFEDVSPEPYIFESTKLPMNGTEPLPRFMPSVGNGHVATTPRTKWLFMNGLYNGERGDSHRARIPAALNRHIDTTGMTVSNEKYGLNVAGGYYYEQFDYQSFTVQTRMYAHRLYHRVLVTQFVITSTNATAPFDFKLAQPWEDSKNATDLVFPGEPEEGPTPGGPEGGSVIALQHCGSTAVSEDTAFQPHTESLCWIQTMLPESLAGTGSQTFTFWASYDKGLTAALNDFINVQLLNNKNDDSVFTTHTKIWNDIWKSASVTVEGDVSIGKLIYGCFYYILSSIPYTEGSNPYDGQFYGLSPGGLAYGDYLSDYQGHSFWDTETWMYPTVLYFFPSMAQSILNYRLHAVPTARDRANTTGYEGSRFPWESAFTGREVTPDCCPETRDLQIHNTGDIAFAIRQYVAATRDVDWLKSDQGRYVTNGCGLIREIAEFWVSRSALDEVTNQYEIDDVMCPDEDHYNVNNSIYTNVIAGYSIFFAKYAECMCQGEMDEIPQEWLDVARGLALNYDADMDYHPEFENYSPNMTNNMIKQADVVLLGFPLLYPMSPSTRKNDLEIYENLTRPNGPAMTWAMHTIGFLELGEEEKASQLFNKSYQPYMRQPFKVWTEAQAPEFGAVNFITGMGGFLQEIVSGFGGLRLYPERLEFLHPRTLPGTTSLSLTGIKYLKSRLDVNINGVDDTVTFTLKAYSNTLPLVISYETADMPETWKPLNLVPVVIANSSTARIKIFSTSTPCQLPEDIIGQRVRPEVTTPRPGSTTPGPGVTTPDPNGASAVSVSAGFLWCAALWVCMLSLRK